MSLAAPRSSHQILRYAVLVMASVSLVPGLFMTEAAAIDAAALDRAKRATIGV